MTQKQFFHPAVIVHELHPVGVIRRQAFLPNKVRSVGGNPLQMKAVAVELSLLLPRFTSYGQETIL
jgi:hypothetical protein